MNQHPLHSDAHYAETHTQHKQRVVLGPLVYSVVIGMTVADISGRAIANLEVDALKHEKPTFIGDTLYAKQPRARAAGVAPGRPRHRHRRHPGRQPARRNRVLLYPSRARAPEEPRRPSARAGSPTDMTRPPLDGVRILAVSQFGAGPFGTQMLADLGADIIKIEDPGVGGDSARYVPPFQGEADSPYFQSFNRGKRSVSLNLRHPDGQAVFHDLVRVSDAVFNNARGDLPDKLGLTYEALCVR